MGCSESCFTFEKFPSFLKRGVPWKSGLSFIAHYLDDFHFMGPVGTGQCGLLLETFTALCE